jgi:hypothetical protein
MIVALVALVVALAGSAIAATKLTKRDKRQVRAIATRATEQLAPGLSVAHAQTAGNADQAQSAQNAANAQNAVSAEQAQNAATADDANTLGGQSPSSFLPAGAVIRIPPTQLTDSQMVQPVDLPDIDIFVSCEIDNVGQDVVDTEVAFSGTGAVIYGGAFSNANSSGDVFPSFQQGHSASPSINQQTVTIVASGGRSLTGVIWNGFNLGGTADRCNFGGHLVSSG